MKVSRIRCKSALSRSGLYDLDYSYNPYLGCYHGCRYCYSVSILSRELALDWGNFVFVKENVIEVLRQEVLRKKRGVVGVSTASDPYQPVEKVHELTRKGIEVLRGSGFHVSIQTRSPLVLRDADLIKGPGFDLGVTITTLDEWVARKVEPKSPRPLERAKVLEEYSGKVDTWLFFGPIIPFLADGEDNVRAVVKLASKCGSHLLYDKLRVKKWIPMLLRPALERIEEGLYERVMDRVRDQKYWQGVFGTIERACRDYGVRCEPSMPSYSRPKYKRL